MEIAKSGNVSLLNSTNNLEEWEEIVRLNCINNDIHDYVNYLNALRSLSLLVNQYIAVKAHLSKLSIPVFTGGKIDIGSVEYLRSKGYEINMETKETYIISIQNALKKRENLMTRINMKRKEIEKLSTQHGKTVGDDKGVEQLLATLSFQLGFSVSDDITLARFNEYTKIVKVQAEHAKNHGRN